MGDERLRELERRWRESGSPESEAGWLLERVRLGELDSLMLDLAAHLGHPGARIARGFADPFPTFAEDEEDEEGKRRLLRPWSSKIAQLSAPAARRAAAAAARGALPHYEAVWQSPAPRCGVEELERLVKLGAKGDSQNLKRLGGEVEAAIPDRGYGQPTERVDRAESAGFAVFDALHCFLSPRVGLYGALNLADRAMASSRFESDGASPCDWSRCLASPVSSSAIVALVQAALVPWALGIASDGVEA